MGKFIANFVFLLEEKEVQFSVPWLLGGETSSTNGHGLLFSYRSHRSVGSTYIIPLPIQSF